MKRIASHKGTKYLLGRIYDAPLTNGGTVKMIEYFTVDLIRNLIGGTYSFQRMAWNMMLNNRHKEIFQLDAAK